MFCSDEIFAKKAPILITVDPISFMILNIVLAENRTGESWEDHWGFLLGQGYYPLYITKDEGLAMKAAQSAILPEVRTQSDTFHAVSHRLGSWNDRLEKAALAAIGNEYECYRLLINSKSDKTFEKRSSTYRIAQKACADAILLYDMFDFLYSCLLACFQVFDSSGKIKNTQAVISDFCTALDMIKSLGHVGINEEVKSIDGIKNDLFYFMEIAMELVSGLEAEIDTDILNLLCMAHQTQKNIVKIKNKKEVKNKLVRRVQYILKDVRELVGDESQYQLIKNKVYLKLDQIVQSSASVECINSILRPYLNTSKNQPTQELLNLFMFYHNHRRFAEGKRKNKTPYELFTGEKQEDDWLELLIKKMAA